MGIYRKQLSFYLREKQKVLTSSLALMTDNVLMEKASDLSVG
ncbi:hypothetical protein ACF3DV_01720 [Chlorogloeopsis fritschii PCC 9212]|nr:hypothetical protein [Chlorogloeopsis fritschii]